MVTPNHNNRGSITKGNEGSWFRVAKGPGLVGGLWGKVGGEKSCAGNQFDWFGGVNKSEDVFKLVLRVLGRCGIVLSPPRRWTEKRSFIHPSVD